VPPRPRGGIIPAYDLDDRAVARFFPHPRPRAGPQLARARVVVFAVRRTPGRRPERVRRVGLPIEPAARRSPFPDRPPPDGAADATESLMCAASGPALPPGAADIESFALDAWRRLGSPAPVRRKGPAPQRMPGDGELSGDVGRMPSENADRMRRVKELFEGES